MWTHIHPQINSELTKNSIAYEGRLGLYRALNIGELIVMAGSGVTRLFGYPTWTEFVLIFAQIVKEELKEFSKIWEKEKTFFLELSDMLDEYHDLIGEKPTKNYSITIPDLEKGKNYDVLALLDLLKAILDELDRSRRRQGIQKKDDSHYDCARKKFAHLFKEERAKRLVEIVACRLSIDLAEEKQKRISLTSSDMTLLDLIYKLVKKKLEKWPSFLASLKSRKFNEENELPCKINPVHSILKTLHVRRVVTLNYDIEFERHLLQHRKITDQIQRIKFETLCDKTVPLIPEPRRVTLSDGTQRAALSTTMAAENIAAIANFGAHSRSFRGQIFHFHGRADDPSNMVVTQADYLGIYAKNEEARRTFDEAREILFGGNDILFLGTGLTEEEVLQPFRRFLGRGRYSRASHSITALIFSSYTKKGMPDEAAMSAKAIKYKSAFGINVIHIGGATYMHTMASLDQISNKIDDYLLKYKEKAPTVLGRYIKILSKKNKNNPIFPEKEFKIFNKIFSRLYTQIKKQQDIDKEQDEIEKERVKAQHEIEKKQANKLAQLALDNIKDHVRSLTLVYELDRLSKSAANWWDAWRTPPGERIARYSTTCLLSEDNKKPKQVKTCSTENNNFWFWARHCTDYKHVSCSSEAMWSPISKAKIAFRKAYIAVQEKKLIAFEERARPENEAVELPQHRRILRVAIPRGGGKGAFVTRLFDPNVANQLFGNMIFNWKDLKAAKEDNTSSVDYAAAFFVHLSFSIEFSSAITALTRFLAHHCAKVMTRLGCAEDEAIQNNIESSIKDKYREAKEEDKNSNGSKTKESFEDRLKSCWVDEPRKIPSLDEIKKRTFQFDIKSTAPPVAFKRLHRLDVLRRAMEVYACLCQLPSQVKEHNRLLLCFSNLDQLCTEKGDAYNAMHRAFFRLLSGQYEGELDGPDMPLDIVLVSGNPEVPIRYLSEEGLNVRNLDPVKQEKYSYLTETKLPLRRWHKLSVFTWPERAYISPFVADLPEPNGTAEWIRAPDPKSSKTDLEISEEHHRLCVFLGIMEDTGVDRRPLDPTHNHRYRVLIRLLWDNLALSIWVLTYWCKKAPDVAKKNRKKRLQDILDILDRAASRKGYHGVVDALLMLYHDIDQKNFSELRQRAPSKPSYEIVDPHLMDLILKHLTLFALPVELSVLLGCPLIATQLKQLTSDESDENGKSFNNRPSAKDSKRWISRYLEFHTLHHHLSILEERGLIVPVLPSYDEPVANGSKSKEDDSPDEREQHRRYVLHARLREHIAHKMNLSLADRGDRRNHQISLYCDQPRDLPTPSAEHYALLSGILDRQIRLCRESLWSARRFREVLTVTEKPEDGKIKFAARAIVRRTMVPEDYKSLQEKEFKEIFRPDGLAGGFRRIHAVPQRLRGLMCLLRGSFSLGAISRLDDVDLSRTSSTPFESYRRWLRSLLNAAVSLEASSTLIEDTLRGYYFSNDGTEFKIPEEYKKDKKDKKKAAQQLVAEANEAKKDIKFVTAQKTNFTRLRNPFYRDEIAWLYNERGLTSLMQGRIFDALPLFEQARFIMTHKRTPQGNDRAFHAAERRISLNIAITEIDRGNLAEARRLLLDLEMTTTPIRYSTPSHLTPFVTGYLALCDHLTGSLQKAEQGYKQVVTIFSNRRMHRALAIFNRHWADLLSRRGEYDDAFRRAKLAESAASEAAQRDVLNHALISLAQAEVHRQNYDNATAALNRALSYGERMGLYRLQADALLGRSKLYLSLGDAGLAGTAAAQAIAICSRHGLQLRKLTGLYFYADTQYRAGKIDLAHSILEEAKTEAERLGYQTMSSNAAEMLSILELNRLRAIENQEHRYGSSEFNRL